jgi:hypothetical protein
MKVYLDDCRPTPVGWIGCRWPSEVVDLLLAGSVTDLSLDHDLGDAEDSLAENRKEITGYDVLVWLEEKVCLDRFDPPASIVVHSSNAAARKKMQAAIDNIYRLSGRKDWLAG